ncbi:MAG: Ig-like domain-containing protein [Pseudomonadota bacterium]
MYFLISIIMLAMFLAGCGMQGIGQFDSLISMQPQVLSVTPADGQSATADTSVTVEFSRSIDPASVNESTLAIIKPEDPDEDIEGIADDVEDGDVRGIEGFYEFKDESRIAVFRAKQSFEKGATYILVASSQILSPDLLPLNQNPGSAPKPFFSTFTVMADGQGQGQGEVQGQGEGEAEVKRIRPTHLIINEILYDAVGTDTDGDVFVELLGEAGGDITGYKLVFVNGEDGIIKDDIEMPEDAVIGDDEIFLIADAKTGMPDISNVEHADFIKNFDPQNGPDCVQLLNEKGELLDAMGYGEPILEAAENGLACFEGVPAVDVASGQSLSRIAGIDTNDNAFDFEVLEVPTPGSK